MITTLPPEAEGQIIARLKNGDERNDIIFDLCNSQNLDWKDAEALVESVHAGNADDITLYQSPLLVAVALAIFLGGAGLVAYTTFNQAAMFQAIYRLRSQSPGNGTPVLWGTVHDFLFYLILTGREYVGMLVVGIAMIVGSLRGMQDVWSALFAKTGIFQGR